MSATDRLIDKDHDPLSSTKLIDPKDMPAGIHGDYSDEIKKGANQFIAAPFNITDFVEDAKSSDSRKRNYIKIQQNSRNSNNDQNL